MKRIMFISILFVVTVLNYIWINQPLLKVELSHTILVVVSIIVGVVGLLSLRLPIIVSGRSPAFFEGMYALAVVFGSFIGSRYLLYALGTSTNYIWWIPAVCLGIVVLAIVEQRKTPSRYQQK
jgi:hypothetical protein